MLAKSPIFLFIHSFVFIPSGICQDISVDTISRLIAKDAGDISKAKNYRRYARRLNATLSQYNPEQLNRILGSNNVATTLNPDNATTTPNPDNTTTAPTPDNTTTAPTPDNAITTPTPDNTTTTPTPDNATTTPTPDTDAEVINANDLRILLNRIETDISILEGLRTTHTNTMFSYTSKPTSEWPKLLRGTAYYGFYNKLKPSVKNGGNTVDLAVQKAAQLSDASGWKKSLTELLNQKNKLETQIKSNTEFSDFHYKMLTAPTQVDYTAPTRYKQAYTFELAVIKDSLELLQVEAKIARLVLNQMD